MTPLPSVAYTKTMFAMARGLLTAYEDRGKGPAVVLLHGLGATGHAFDRVVEALEDRYRLIVPDLLGNGRTEKPEGDYSPAALAGHVADLLDRIGVGPLHAIAGHSLGAAVAIELAARRPGAGLCLIDPPPPGGSRLVGLAASLAGGKVSIELGSLLVPTRWLTRRWLRFLFADPERLSEETIARYTEAALLPGYAYATVRSIRALGRLALPQPRVAGTLILWGEEDPIFPASGATAWLARFPAAEVVLLPACGHCPTEETPSAVAASLSAFLGKLP